MPPGWASSPLMGRVGSDVRARERPCHLTVVDSQNLSGLICKREPGYSSRSRCLRRSLKLSPRQSNPLWGSCFLKTPCAGSLVPTSRRMSHTVLHSTKRDIPNLGGGGWHFAAPGGRSRHRQSIVSCPGHSSTDRAPLFAVFDFLLPAFCSIANCSGPMREL